MDHYFPTLIVPRTDPRQLEKLLPSAAYWHYSNQPAYPLLSYETIIMALDRIFILSFFSSLALVLPHTVVQGMACSFLLRTVRHTLSFQCQLSADLLALPYWNNNKTFTSKQFHWSVSHSNLFPYTYSFVYYFVILSNIL